MLQKNFGVALPAWILVLLQMNLQRLIDYFE
jgi:hypothetical protein